MDGAVRRLAVNSTRLNIVLLCDDQVNVIVRYVSWYNTYLNSLLLFDQVNDTVRYLTKYIT